jgi:hypothetical protein
MMIRCFRIALFVTELLSNIPAVMLRYSADTLYYSQALNPFAGLSVI